MTILLTGVAGFIGFHTARALLEAGQSVVGIDNLNAYYDPQLKRDRLSLLEKYPHFTFLHRDVSDRTLIEDLPSRFPDTTEIIHLAAQAGVRHSLTAPFDYIEANITGHLVMLELARKIGKQLRHFIYASSSSVYGSNKKLPYAVEDRTDHPISLYAATKRADELMSESYSHLFRIPATGLRFFTVYGPWGRPDQSAFLFTKAILAGEPISVFNHGHMRRNYTYIDDVVAALLSVLTHPPQEEEESTPHRIYNIGNDQSEGLMDFITTLEKTLGETAQKEWAPLQPGDVLETIADVEPARRDFGFVPKTGIQEGLRNFVAWYREYFQCPPR